MSLTEATRPQARTEATKARMLIGGAWVDGATGITLTIENLAKRRPIAEVPRGGAADVDRAVEAAAKAFPAWSRTVPRDRGRIFLSFAEAVEARAEEIARTIAKPGMRCVPRRAARRGSPTQRFAPRIAQHLLTKRDRLISWNAPVLPGALKIAPALCAHNTLVLKVAEDAPLGVLTMAEICQQFLPKGVLNALTGLGHECGAPLAQHPLVRKLSFTGSTEVRKLIMRAAADWVVPVSLELKTQALKIGDSLDEAAMPESGSDGISVIRSKVQRSRSGSRHPA